MLYSLKILRTDQENSHHSSENITTGSSGALNSWSTKSIASAVAGSGLTSTAGLGAGAAVVSKR
jgi:hypothetical protein